MRVFLAFLKKEILAQLRTARLPILAGVFVLFGIMNPAIAKLTPWLLDQMSEAMAQTGMTITAGSVSALDSWVQFFKNIPMALIIFVILESNIFTGEYRSGTLVLSLTKGLDRYKVLIAKTAVLTVLWTLGFWVCYGITYGCNRIFWEEQAAQHLLLSVSSWWVFGLWVLMLVVLFSTVIGSNIGVLGSTAGMVLVTYLLSLLPKLKEYLPTYLIESGSLIYGMAAPSDYVRSLVVTGVLSAVIFAVSIPLFNKKQL